MKLRELAQYVTDHEGSTAQAVASRFGVTARSVRTYVKQFNDVFEGCAELAYSRSKGYELKVTDRPSYDALLARLGALQDSGAPSGENQRVAFLLDNLLSRTDWARLDDLAQALLVSRRTVTKDMRRVEECLAEFGLVLEQRPRYGIRVEGPEAAKRSCWTSAVVLFGEGVPNDERAKKLAARIEAIVEEALAGAGKTMSSVALQNLVPHIVIAAIRAGQGAHIPPASHAPGSLYDAETLGLARSLAARIEADLDVELPDGEVEYIAVHLAGGRLESLLDAAPTAEAPADEEIWDIAARMIDVAYDVFGFDLRGDIELRMNLCRHIAPLGVRLSTRMKIKNPLLTETKSRYPLAYAMAADASSVLVERFGNVPSDDEIAYIALSFALALERRRNGAPKKRVLLVCASGAGTSRLLAFRFREAFGPLLESVETCDVHAVASRDFSQIDYVFTTVPLPAALPVPVQQIGVFLDDSDIDDVNRALRTGTRSTWVLQYFDERLFLTHLSLATRDAVIEHLAAKMVEAYGADLGDGFAASVFAREEAFSTAFGNLVAMPHPAEAQSSVTAACIGLLDEPVAWDARGNEVRVVIMMAFSKEDTEGLKDLMSLLADLLTNPDLVSGLLASQDWDFFLHMLIESNSQRGEAHE